MLSERTKSAEVNNLEDAIEDYEDALKVLGEHHKQEKNPAQMRQVPAEKKNAEDALEYKPMAWEASEAEKSEVKPSELEKSEDVQKEVADGEEEEAMVAEEEMEDAVEMAEIIGGSDVEKSEEKLRRGGELSE